jgi:hypothetical protein
MSPLKHPIFKLYCLLKKQLNIIFPESGEKLKITRRHGVYIIFNSQDLVMYVGKTNSAKDGLCQRLNDHLGKNSSFTKNHIKPDKLDVRGGYYFRYLEIEDSRDRTFVEAMAAGYLCPKYIGTGKK